MNKFFTQTTCDRCGGSLEDGRIMSMFNTQCICMECKDKETRDKNYTFAVQQEHAEVIKGNYNYKGIKG